MGDMQNAIQGFVVFGILFFFSLIAIFAGLTKPAKDRRIYVMNSLSLIGYREYPDFIQKVISQVSTRNSQIEYVNEIEKAINHFLNDPVNLKRTEDWLRLRETRLDREKRRTRRTT